MRLCVCTLVRSILPRAVDTGNPCMVFAQKCFATQCKVLDDIATYPMSNISDGAVRMCSCEVNAASCSRHGQRLYSICSLHKGNCLTRRGAHTLRLPAHLNSPYNPLPAITVWAYSACACMKLAHFRGRLTDLAGMPLLSASELISTARYFLNHAQAVFVLLRESHACSPHETTHPCARRYLHIQRVST